MAKVHGSPLCCCTNVSGWRLLWRGLGIGCRMPPSWGAPRVHFGYCFPFHRFSCLLATRLHPFPPQPTGTTVVWARGCNTNKRGWDGLLASPHALLRWGSWWQRHCDNGAGGTTACGGPLENLCDIRDADVVPHARSGCGHSDPSWDPAVHTWLDVLMVEVMQPAYFSKNRQKNSCGGREATKGKEGKWWEEGSVLLSDLVTFVTSFFALFIGDMCKPATPSPPSCQRCWKL